MRAYARFGLMIAAATVVMYLLTYANTYVAEHVAFSEMRSYMALLMAGAAQIEDPRVRELADRIVETQEREIAQMKALVAELEARD